MYSVIIVDDEEFITTSLSKHIIKYHTDFRVNGCFTNGGDALAFLQKFPVDIIITDIRMPYMDGLELIKRIRKLLPEIYILIISGYSEFEYAQKALAYNVRNYLLKPIDLQELSDNLKEIKEQLQKKFSDTIYSDEDIQLFFIDLLSRMIFSKKELNRRFSQLSLADKAEDYKGCIISITLNQASLRHWQYGNDTLPTALLNNVRMFLPDYESFYLYRHQACFFFILLSSQNIPSFSADTFLTELEQTMHWNATLNTTTTFNSLEALLSVSVLSSESSEKATDADLVIQQAKNYIQAHYADNLSREDVANAVYLNSVYFSQLFKQKTGISFISYLTTVRMEKAAELLKTQMSINNIAEAVGYLHRNRFIVNFRQYSGYTPSEYRRKILAEDMTNEK